MNYENMLNRLDHTYLKPSATWKDIKLLCEEGVRYHVASVCIPPAYVKRAKEYFGNKVKICTVVGFPNGYNTYHMKVQETQEMVSYGASEIDMVVNIGFIKEGLYNRVFDEIRFVKDVVEDKILKVIIEACLLSEEEKIKMCEIITEAGADFLKTSTGFSEKGAAINDISLFKKYLGSNIKIKAAGGINSFKSAQEFLDMGVDRLGSSSIVGLVIEESNKGMI